MQDWSIQIRKVNNGFMVETNEVTDNITVFEEKDGELACMKDLLFYIKQYFDCYYSKHNEQNLYIEIKDEK